MTASNGAPFWGENSGAVLKCFIGEIVFAQHVDMGPSDRGMGGYCFQQYIETIRDQLSLLENDLIEGTTPVFILEWS
jgi:hypothetical protein